MVSDRDRERRKQRRMKNGAGKRGGWRTKQFYELKRNRHLVNNQLKVIVRSGQLQLSVDELSNGVAFSRVIGEGIAIIVNDQIVAYVEVIESSFRRCRLKTFAPDTVEIGRSLPP